MNKQELLNRSRQDAEFFRKLRFLSKDKEIPMSTAYREALPPKKVSFDYSSLEDLRPVSIKK